MELKFGHSARSVYNRGMQVDGLPSPRRVSGPTPRQDKPYPYTAFSLYPLAFTLSLLRPDLLRVADDDFRTVLVADDVAANLDALACERIQVSELLLV